MRARLSFADGRRIEFVLDEVVAYGPEIRGFAAWLGAVNASTSGRWLIRLTEDRVLGFRREELKRVHLAGGAAELTLGEGASQRTLPIRAEEIVSFGPEPDDVRSWLGRLAHGEGEAWVRLADGRELRFPIGGGPHVRILEPTERRPAER